MISNIKRSVIYGILTLKQSHQDPAKRW
jgi:hypothetical protein